MNTAPFLPEILVTGGQTGADRAAMDFALKHRIPLEGYCPHGREAEDGPIPECYPLIEIAGGYDERTLKNLLFADATVIFFAQEPIGGTALTLQLCQQYQRPCRSVNINAITPTESLPELYKFLHKYRPHRVNIAGPRASQCSAIYGFVYQTLALCFATKV